MQRAHWVDYGADFYAATSFNDLPDGKQVLIGWMNNWNYAGSIPTSPWRSADSVPRQLALQDIGGKIQLTQQPVGNLSKLHTGAAVTGGSKPITGTISAGISGPTLDLDGTFAPRYGQPVRPQRAHRRRAADPDRLRHHDPRGVHRPHQVW